MIPIASIKMDRYPMNPSTLGLVDYLRKGGLVPPIKVAKSKGGGFVIRDGRHRVLANKLIGNHLIEAKFSSSPMIK